MTAARISQTQTVEQHHYQQQQYRDEQRGYATTLPSNHLEALGNGHNLFIDRNAIHMANMSMRQSSTSPTFNLGGAGSMNPSYHASRNYSELQLQQVSLSYPLPTHSVHGLFSFFQCDHSLLLLSLPFFFLKPIFSAPPPPKTKTNKNLTGERVP